MSTKIVRHDPFLIVAHGNPALASVIVDKRRYNNTGDLKAFLINGKRVCAWCGKNELPKDKRLKYCSPACRESANLCFAPQSVSGRGFLLYRQGFKCFYHERCNADWTPFVEVIKLHFKKYNLLFSPFMLGKYTGFGYIIEKKDMASLGLPRMEIHHIVPVADGGDCFGFDNLQLLCERCHKQIEKRKDLL